MKTKTTTTIAATFTAALLLAVTGCSNSSGDKARDEMDWMISGMPSSTAASIEREPGEPEREGFSGVGIPKFGETQENMGRAKITTAKPVRIMSDGKMGGPRVPLALFKLTITAPDNAVANMQWTGPRAMLDGVKAPWNLDAATTELAELTIIRPGQTSEATMAFTIPGGGDGTGHWDFDILPATKAGIEPQLMWSGWVGKMEAGS